MPTGRSSNARLYLVIVALNILVLVKYSLDTPTGIGFRFSHREDKEQTIYSHPDAVDDVSASLESSPSGNLLLRSTDMGKRSIQTIRLLGERHSGTTYLTRYLQNCFSRRQVLDFLVRKKHWFQPSPDAVAKVANSVDRSTLGEATDFRRFDQEYKTWWDISQDSESRKVFQSSLVLYLVRDPYQWMEAMRLRPWHWPNHLKVFPKNQTTIAKMKYHPDRSGERERRQLQYQRLERPTQYTSKVAKSGEILTGSMRVQKSFVDHTKLDWHEFVHAPMYLVDEEVSDSRSRELCQKGFPKGSISPCLQNQSYVPPALSHIPIVFLRNLPFSVQDVVYEQQLDGRPFDHPLALRAAKIRNLLKLEEMWDLGGFRLIRYEDILGGADNGTTLQTLVEQVEEALGARSTCNPHKAEEKIPYQLPKDFMKWVGDNADWETEERLGYSPTPGTR